MPSRDVEVVDALDVRGRLVIIYSGELADSGVIPLDEYIALLAGWRDFFRITGELFYGPSFLFAEAFPTIEWSARRPGWFMVIGSCRGDRRTDRAESFSPRAPADAGAMP